MIIEAIKIISKLLKDTESILIRDEAGIITAQGIDAAARVKALKDCLHALRKEGIK